MVTRIGPKKPHRVYLAEWRIHKKLSQEQVAARCETTAATISRWETGDRDPPLKALYAFAEAVNASVASLFSPPDRPSADALLSESPEKTVRVALKVVTDLVEDDKKDGTNR